MEKYPKTVKWMVCSIPVLDFALKVALLYWVQSIFLKATAENGTVAVNGKAATTSGKAATMRGKAAVTDKVVASGKVLAAANGKAPDA
ncbi:hypothetical protein HanHA300_Chr11g0418351 [Helianthus annuus]|nr:hypothetical protein HanHA300_Chr11g0418351 [Helianthus annuus]KAJ0518877.1 hypothetical protein HanHA89_Chr11g0442381 [Helianthus annuus]